MKNIKLIVLLLIVCLAFTACSPDKADSDSRGGEQSLTDVTGAAGEAAETEKSYYDTLGERDFDGETFTILDACHHPHIQVNKPVDEGLNGEPINDALYNRDKFIEEKYGVNIEYIQIVGAGGCPALEKSVLAGENTYDLVVSPILGNSLNTISTRNVLCNLTDMPYLSLESPWWSKMIYENLQFNGKLFYNGGDIFLPSFSRCPGAVMFNKKLFQDYGIKENLYDLVFDGKWTVDVLERLIKDADTDVNQDGKMHVNDDFFGLVTQTNDITTGFFLAGLGVNFATVADDTINVDLTSPATLSKIDKLTGILKPVQYADHNDVMNKAFKEGRALFVVHCLETPQLNLRDMADDYGILPMPKWDEKQESYVSFINAWGSGFIGVPLNADIEKSAFLTEAMAYAGYEMLRRPVYEITLKAKAARDEESERIIDIIIETAYLDLNVVYDFGRSQTSVMNAIFKNTPFISEYEKVEGKIQKDIDKFIEAMSAN